VGAASQAERSPQRIGRAFGGMLGDVRQSDRIEAVEPRDGVVRRGRGRRCRDQCSPAERERAQGKRT
jgi:hypothetical protein